MGKKFAVFIDGDNISSQYLNSIMAEVSKEGDILVKRIYGDWTTTNMNTWKDKVFNTPVRIFQQFRFGPNATDNSIIMDAIELSNENSDINAYCIVSIDSDYYSLALRLRENGKFVLGIGRENSKTIWKNSCNQFVLLENIYTIEPEVSFEDSEKQSHDSIIDIDQIISFAFENAKANDIGWVSLSDIGKAIRSRYPSFDPRTYNHRNLYELLNALSETIEIQRDVSNPQQLWTRKIKKDNCNNGKIDGVIKRFLGGYGFIECEKGDFFFTLPNIDIESRGKKIRKGAKVRFSVFKYPDLLKEETSERNGKASEIEIIE